MDFKLIRKNILVQYVKDKILYATEDHIVWRTTDHGKTWEKVCCLATDKGSWYPYFKNKLLRSTLVRRFRRNIGINNVVITRRGTLIIQYDKIYRYDGTSFYASPVFDYEKLGISGPLKNGLAYDENSDLLYFGEYNVNRPRAIRVVRGIDDGRSWDICYQFPTGRIRHVHSIVPDAYRGVIWITAGDNNHESTLFYTDDGFQSMKSFGGGDQSWRMISLIPTEDALIWGSDAGKDAPPDSLNYIYRWEFSKNKRERLACIDNPAYYSHRLADGRMFIGSTYEPGMQRSVAPCAEIWSSRDGLNWSRELAFRYHPSGRKYETLYATVNFPLGDTSSDRLFFTLLNVKSLDFHLLCEDISTRQA
ncbi:MAG: hypothetical protein C4576_35330 [Desulfobacteraceae bacterium]|nr:MAG: hypothetical protein C4576_35330 [Desulfobacteraceae bacterium]